MKVLKQLFATALMSSALIFSACNNAATTDDTAAGEDSASQMGTEAGDNNAAGSNIITKSGIPLTSDQEVPVNDSKASGTANVAYNKESQILSFTVNWSGLTGEPTMAHIHGTAPKGTNAGVKEDLTKLLTKSTSGSFADSVKIDGSTIREDSLLAGFYYFNIHTPKHPGGEIRGQIILE